MKSVAVVGAGLEGLRLWEALVRCGSVDVVAFVDADARLHGRSRAGLPIQSPAWLDAFTGDLVAGSSGSGEERRHGHRVVRLPTHLDDAALLRAALATYPDPLDTLLATVAPSTKSRRVGIFGTGAAATRVWEALSELDDLEPVWFADNDVRQQGREFLWLPVIAPAAIPSHEAELVIVGSMSREPIRRQLLRLGVPENRILAPDVGAESAVLRAELRQFLPDTAIREVLV